MFQKRKSLQLEKGRNIMAKIKKSKFSGKWNIFYIDFNGSQRWITKNTYEKAKKIKKNLDKRGM